MEQLNKYFQKKGYTTGPLGFPLRDEAARQLEADLKIAESLGLGYLRKFVRSDKLENVDDGTRTEVSVVTDETVDRDNEVVLARGLSVSDYEKNPIVLWSHNGSQPPIGRAEWVKPFPNKAKPNAVKAKTQYTNEGDNPLADTVWKLTQSGFIKTKSIGFAPLEIGPVTQKEIDARPELERVKHIIRRSSLYEISVAPLPSNPSALVEQVAKGKLLLPEWLYDQMGLAEAEEDGELLVKCAECWEWPNEVVVPKYSLNLSEVERKLLNRLR